MIYNFITNTPITVNDKNYCINYIFDANNNNNLVQISYQKISADNLTIASETGSPTIGTDNDDDTGGFLMNA